MGKKYQWPKISAEVYSVAFNEPQFTIEDTKSSTVYTKAMFSLFAELFGHKLIKRQFKVVFWSAVSFRNRPKEVLGT